jgi:hypothetical protein
MPIPIFAWVDRLDDGDVGRDAGGDTRVAFVGRVDEVVVGNAEAEPGVVFDGAVEPGI